MDQVPDRETLLAMRTPAELFGDDAADGKALRRAWARLVRTYTPDDDPEVFQHARALFERARDALEAPTVAPEVAPEPALQAALENQDFQEVFRVLRAHGPQLATQAPETLGRAIRITLMAVGPRCGPTALDDLELLLGRPEWNPDPALIRECEDDLIFLRALTEAATDPRVPPEMIAAIRAMFRRNGATALEAFDYLAKELPPDRLEGALAYLYLAHGTVARQIVRSESLVAYALRGSNPSETPTDTVEDLREAVASDTMQPVEDGAPMVFVERYWHLVYFVAAIVAQLLGGARDIPWGPPYFLMVAAAEGQQAWTNRERMMKASPTIAELSRATGWRRLRANEHNRAAVVAAAALIAAICTIADVGPGFESMLVAAIGLRLVASIWPMIVVPRAPFVTRPDEVRAQLVAELTRSGATPAEFARMLVGGTPFALGLAEPWRADHPLIVLQAKPAATLRHAGPALRARLEAGAHP